MSFLRIVPCRESLLLIQHCLIHEAYNRPTMAQIYLDPIFAGFTPDTLPTSVYTVALLYSITTALNQAQSTIINPNKIAAPIQQAQSRRPFTEQQQNDQALLATRHPHPSHPHPHPSHPHPHPQLHNQNYLIHRNLFIMAGYRNEWNDK
jgi:hypothetical protein